jgi:hypothetical protein
LFSKKNETRRQATAPCASKSEINRLPGISAHVLASVIGAGEVQIKEPMKNIIIFTFEVDIS